MEAEFVRVTNHEARLLHLPDAVMKTGVKGEDGKLTDVRLTFGDGKALVPGGNNVARDEWERAKTYPTVKGWLQLGWLTEGGDVEQPEGPEPPKDLSGYNVTTALALIDGEDNHNVLRRWFAAESRADVTAAIKRRMEAVGLPPLPPLKGKRQ